jgi:hypothetical protein
MNSIISGWRYLNVVILAALLVFPPDLTVPAKISYPLKKEIGPDAVPPLEIVSPEDLILLKS